MQITVQTSKEEVLETLRGDLKELGIDDKILRDDCYAMLEKLAAATLNNATQNRLRILDVFDDRTTPDKAIKFYLKGDNAEAHVMLHDGNSISLDINDIGEEKFREGYDKQHLRLLGETTTRRLPCCKQSMDVVMMLISSTRW